MPLIKYLRLDKNKMSFFIYFVLLIRKVKLTRGWTRQSSFMLPGSFDTVHRVDWNGVVAVAVMLLSLSLEQDFHARKFNEFWMKVAIIRCLQHQNIVLFWDLSLSHQIFR